MIDPNIRRHIETVLEREGHAHSARILYAAESGSRAWGFGSPGSDFDVRFIYVHPSAFYVRLAEHRDVIERPLDPCLVDLAGWDVRKALRLALKSNPALYEWLVSPIVYADDGNLRPAMKALFEAHASPRALAWHYWSIARGQWKREVDGRGEVRQKKYF
jgi:predicted nucleotidyltransferase